MKTMKKLLLALLAVVLVSAAMLISVFAADLPWGDTATADQHISAVNNAPFEEKKALIEAYDEYMNTHRFPDNKLGQINMHLHLARAKQAKYDVTLASIEALKSNPAYTGIELKDEMTRDEITKNIAYYNTLLAHYEDIYYFDKTVEEYKAFAAELLPKVEALKELYNERLLEYYTPPLAEYDYKTASKYTFEEGPDGKITSIGLQQFTKENAFSEIVKDFGSQGSDSSILIHIYNKTGDPYPMINFASNDIGVVLEFDVYFTDPNFSLQMECGTQGLSGSNSSYGSFNKTQITSGGADATAPHYVPFENSANLMVENAWNRIAIAFNNQTKVFTTYVNFVEVGSFVWSEVNKNYTVKTIRFRGAVGCDMWLDNIVAYYGTAPRITDQLTAMDDIEKLEFYNNILENKDGYFDFANRETAYNWITANFSTYYANGAYTDIVADSEKAKAIVDNIREFDFTAYKVGHHVEQILNNDEISITQKLAYYNDLDATIATTEYLDENKQINTTLAPEESDLYKALYSYLYEIDPSKLIDEFQISNLDGLKALYDELVAVNEMDYGTIEARENAITAIDLYVVKTGLDNISKKEIEKDGEEPYSYAIITKGIEAEKDKIAFDKVVRTIDSYIGFFNKASKTNYVTKARWQRRINEEMYYKNVSIFTDTEKEKHLPAMLEGWGKLNEEMAELNKGYNSSVAIQCIDLVKEYALKLLNKAEDTEVTLEALAEELLTYVKAEYDAYLADPTAEKPAWDYVRRYILMARASMPDGGYDENYGGLADAKTFYDPIFDYYYDLVQLEHVAHLNETLARYESATTYIDKKGICTYVENYLVENDIDHTREDIAAIKERVDAISAEIVAGEGEDQSAAEREYLAKLEENAGKFITAVDAMKVAADYVTLYAAYQNAQQYYYLMAITDENVQTAVVTYMELEGKLRAWKDSSDLFIGIVGSMSNTDTLDQTYAKLVKAYAVKELTEATYPGMREALSAYDAAYATYTATVNAVNGEVMETVEVMTSQNSSYSVMEAVIGFFKKLFG